MYPISAVYADYLQRHDREFVVRADVGGVTYDNSVIAELSIESSLTLSEGLEIGTANLAKLTIKLRTEDVVPGNARIVPYLAVSTRSQTWGDANYAWDAAVVEWEGGISDWLPLGEFFVDDRQRVNDVWVFTCFDKLVFADAPYISSLAYPTTHQAVWEEICGRLGYVSGSSVQLRTGTMPVAPTGFAYRQVLAQLAAANTACLYVDKVGKLQFKAFRGAAAAAIQMTESDYIRVKQVNPLKSYTRVVLVYDTEEGNAYESGSGDENHTLFVTIPFGTQAMADQIRVDLAGFSYTPISMDARGFPHLDLGDGLAFVADESRTWFDAGRTWADMDLPWAGDRWYQSLILRMTLRFAGGLRLQIEAPSVSEQQSEFPVDGALSTAVSNLSKTTVKEARKYYGASLDRWSGLTIERSDNMAKAVFNADELTFYKGSEKALWFDVSNDRYKFTGTLEGVDGVFGGHLEAATGTFKGELQAATGTFSGLLTASTIRGSIVEGTDIRGGTITGSLMRTSEIGSRFEVDANGWRTYDSSNTKRIGVTVDAQYGLSAINWYGEDGGTSGRINGQTSAFQILATPVMFLQSFASIQFGGIVDFGGAQVAGLSMSSVEGLYDQIQLLWNAVNSKSNIGHSHSYVVPSHNHGTPVNFSYSGSTGPG